MPLRDLLAAPAQAAAARHGHPLHRGLHVQLLLGLPARLRRDQPRAAEVTGARRRSWPARHSAWCWCRSPARSPTASAASRSTASGPGSRWCSRSRSPRSCSRPTRSPCSRSSSAGLGVLYGTVYGPLAAFWSRAVRHPLPLHGAEHALPDVRHRGLRPDAAHRGVAGEQGRTARLWLVAGYNVAVAAISLLSARLLPETRGRDLDAPTAAPRTTPAVEALQPASTG